MDENIMNSKPEKKSYGTFIAFVVLALILAAVIVFGVHKYKNSAEVKLEEQSKSLLDSLHIFPPIDFADSLYFKKVLVSYDEDNPRDIFYYEIDSLGNPTKNKVHETHYYPGKKKYVDGNVAKDARDGLWYAYHENGNVQTKAYYVNGKEDGQYAVYYENGNVRYTGKYKAGKRVGTWFFYDESEKLTKTKDFDKNTTKELK